jgi:hypothetical protein
MSKITSFEDFVQSLKVLGVEVSFHQETTKTPIELNGQIQGLQIDMTASLHALQSLRATKPAKVFDELPEQDRRAKGAIRRPDVEEGISPNYTSYVVYEFLSWDGRYTSTLTYGPQVGFSGTQGQKGRARKLSVVIAFHDSSLFYELKDPNLWLLNRLQMYLNIFFNQGALYPGQEKLAKRVKNLFHARWTAKRQRSRELQRRERGLVHA